MNIAYSILSNAAGAEQASGSVIDQLQALGDAHSQLAHESYWGSVGIITVTGILVVFVILGILIFLFWLLGVVFKNVDKRKNAKAEAAKAAAAAAPAQAATAPAPAEDIEDVSTDSDEEIMAVISAAIAAYAEEEGISYTIRNVKRRDNRARSAWSLAGIGENTRPF